MQKARDELAERARALQVQMEEERSRHSIEVQELEGIQREMIKELEAKDGKIAGLEDDVCAETAGRKADREQAAAIQEKLTSDIEGLREALGAAECQHALLEGVLEQARAHVGEVEARARGLGGWVSSELSGRDELERQQRRTRRVRGRVARGMLLQPANVLALAAVVLLLPCVTEE